MKFEAPGLHRRQLWNLQPTTTSSLGGYCTPFTLPSNGVLSLADSVITLTTNVVFQPRCTGDGTSALSPVDDGNGKDPFYASITPQTYVIAAATVIAWILVVMLVITPRTTFIGVSATVPGIGSGRGIIGGATGRNTNIIGVGSRPWLQKIAALMVAIALTIATADTFEVARQQYYTGFMNADALRVAVLGSMEIRVTRVISDIFVWLAQVQTLIRLFPRHKEKVLIKWIGFALIIFDTTFSCLNSFYVQSDVIRPRRFESAIPALSYLFELVLGLLYAAWVIYYAATKRRYAFYHPKMRNICLIALLSLIALLTPVVFFVTDVCNQDVAGWGDYFRWVGAAAASVVVWEWVERIEALERDERKDGILGREIFDGDEMLATTPIEEAIWHRASRGKNRSKGKNGGGGVDGNKSSALEHGLSGVAQRLRGRQHSVVQHCPLGHAHSSITEADADPESAVSKTNHATFSTGPRELERSYQAHPRNNLLGAPTPPPPITSPITRADTISAASTEYVVRYDNTAEVAQPVRRAVDGRGNTAQVHAFIANQHGGSGEGQEVEAEKDQARQDKDRGHSKWQSVANPFKRKRASPPGEVQAATRDSSRVQMPAQGTPRWGRLGALMTDVSTHVRDRSQNPSNANASITVIPAQTRSGRVRTSNETFDPIINGEPASQESTVSPAALAANNVPEPTRHNTARTTSAQNLLHPASLARGRHPHSSASTTYPAREALFTYTPPPRADDISPEPSSSDPVIIPAPRRSPFRG